MEEHIDIAIIPITLNFGSGASEAALRSFITLVVISFGYR